MANEGTDCQRVILAQPRTGSTTLAHLLGTHPKIRCLIEPFHPKRYDGRFHRMALRQSMDAALEFIWRRWNAIKHVSESTGWPFAFRPEMNDRIALGSGYRIVLLTRRNLLRRVVSNAICRKTMFWIGTREQFRHRLDGVTLPALDPERVRSQIEADKAAVCARLRLFEETGVAAMHLHYEDLFREDATPQERLDLLNAVFVFVGLSPIDMNGYVAKCQAYFDPALYRWASEDIYRTIPGIQEVENAVGSDETGWLFR